MAATEKVTKGPHAGLLDWLACHKVDYEVHEHSLTFTARETARVEGVDPRRFAKTLGVMTGDGRRALLVLDAIDHLDLARAERALHADSLRLLSEAELATLFADCDLGAMPAVGELWDLAVYADFAIREDPEITFHAGSHRFTVTVDRVGWERAAHVAYADLSVKADRPVWANA
ncbi:MAG TPA: YbaK/EbsC family protein [Candidatus Limnocylindrales bacterium]